jgi:hypothetical protein
MSHKMARFPLDWRRAWSVTVPAQEDTMDRATIEPAIKLLLIQIHAKLNEASRIAKAAEACAQAGSIAEGVEVSMDIEQLIYEADRLQGAASLLKRLAAE